MIGIEGDLLYLQEGNNPLKLPLVSRPETASSDTVLASRTEGNWVELSKDPNGLVTAFTYHDGNAQRRAVRSAEPRQNRSQSRLSSASRVGLRRMDNFSFCESARRFSFRAPRPQEAVV